MFNGYLYDYLYYNLLDYYDILLINNVLNYSNNSVRYIY